MVDIKEYVKSEKEKVKTAIDRSAIVKGRHPTLAIIKVGNNEASNRYVRNKIKDCSEVGIETMMVELDNTACDEDLLNRMYLLNNDDNVDAYIVQMPLPHHINPYMVNAHILPAKDADGFTNTTFVNPATPYGIIDYLNENQYGFCNKNALIIGRSNIVGKPMAKALIERNCNVTVIHSKTSDENRIRAIQNADLIICAAGVPGLIKKSDFTDRAKDSTFVFDVGINFDGNGKLIGDCEKGLPVAYQSSVPGGVGLLTRLRLLKNVVNLYMLDDSVKSHDRMTNKKWINQMSDQDFVNWIYQKHSVQYVFAKGSDIAEAKAIVPEYSPTLNEVTDSCISAPARLAEWLKEERK